MKKYITVAALLAAGSAFVNAETIHGTTFTPPSAQALHNAYTTSDAASEANALISGKAYYTNDTKGCRYSGFYVASGAGLKFNHSEVVTVTYLYIDESITMKTGTGSDFGAINWSKTDQGKNGIFKISGDEGAWLDINANYGTNINLADMSASSSVYLNTFGQLTTTTNSGYIYATALTDKAVAEASSAYAVEGDSVVRTLLKGDYSSWNGTVVLDGVSEYNVIKDASGLKVAYVIPEPSAFGMLAGLGALALVASRRRRR